MDVAVLGLGRMGTAMARHVLAAGHRLTVWNRTPDRAHELVAAGAREAPTPAEAARAAEVVVLMLGGPESSHDVLFGDGGVASGAARDLLVVDSTTIGPLAARELAAECAQHGLRYVDAPVAGSVEPARQGTLAVLVGGRPEDVADAQPLLELWGDPDKIRHLGPVGSGNAMKVVINLSLGVTAAGLGEALRLADDLGIERKAALTALAAGPFGWMITYKQEMLERDSYRPAAFSLDLLVKDLELVDRAGRRALPLTEAALVNATKAQGDGRGEEDFATLVGWLAGR
ncbi:MAG: NAD(P)-dependent oxidoreductase [Acidothermales bacterium]|nr:NAD(P)-dependent oxidoreductase [Acidothermales bacterium]